jgi:uncharacterized membrane protein required for colicin V production
MPINIVDAIIILFLLMGALIGFKRGVIQSATMFLGIIFVIILAYYLKNPLSEFMYTHLPFFEFSGALKGVTVLNILIYEAIAFLIVFFLLDAILQIAIRATGILEKILKFTIILGIPSKIAGAIFGLLEQFVYVFVFLFLFSRLSFTASYIDESFLATKILNHTPVLSNIMELSFQSFEEIYGLKEKYENSNDMDSYNREALDILLKYEVITVESTEKLIANEKIKIPGVESILAKYREN